MKIGNIEFGKFPLFLAPMEDVTDPSFRFICKHFGADMMYTEFVSSDGLIRNAQKTLKKLEISQNERPIGIQLYGHLLEPMVESAKIAESFSPDIIDINFGCPVRKIATRGAGAGMLQNIPLMLQMTSEIVKAVKIPVTVKTRLGWDESSKNIVDIALRLQDCGIAALTIHGRTRAQLYSGQADWTLIGEVKNHPQIRIPIIGNGDINSPESAYEKFEKYGVDAIMIGRATYGRPWIFSEIKHFLVNGKPAEPLTLAQKVELALMHLEKSIEIKGEVVGVLEMRRHLANYFKNLPNFKPIRQKLVTTSEPEILKNHIKNILNLYPENSELSSVS